MPQTRWGFETSNTRATMLTRASQPWAERHYFPGRRSFEPRLCKAKRVLVNRTVFVFNRVTTTASFDALISRLRSAPGHAGEPQRDSVLQPKVAPSAALPWVTRAKRNQPQRGCVRPPAARPCRKPVGVLKHQTPEQPC